MEGAQLTQENEESLRTITPSRLLVLVWYAWRKTWRDPSYKKVSRTNKKNRAAKPDEFMKHNMGSKLAAEHLEIFWATDSDPTNVVKFYQKGHTQKGFGELIGK